MNEQRREIEDEVTKRQLEVREQKEEQRLGEKPEIKEEVGFVCWLTCRFAKMN